MFITDFELYLRTVGKCGANTTAEFMQFFKRIILIARKNAELLATQMPNLAAIVFVDALHYQLHQ